MKTKFFVTLALAASTAAHADGFLCGTDDRELMVQVYDQTNAAVLVLSDPTAPNGQQLISRFNNLESTQTPQGPVYIATVSKELGDAALQTFVSGTRLGDLYQIAVGVEFDSSNPVAEGTLFPGTLVMQGTDGQSTQKDLTCNRSL